MRRVTPKSGLPKHSTRRGVKYLIGIDASLRNVGVTVINNLAELVLSVNITTKAGTPDHASIDQIVEQLFELLEPYLTPELIARRAVAFFIEEINYTRNGDKTHARAEAAGVIKWLIRQEGINIYGIAPAAANSFIDGRYGYSKARRNSKAQKQHTMDVLHRHCNFYTKNDNIADAYVMALFGYAYLVEKQRLTVKALCKIKF